MLEETVVLLVDKLILMCRNQSPKIYMRYKHPKSGKWLFLSTRTKDAAIAEHFARQKFSEIELKVANNIPTSTYSMKKLIAAYLKELKAEYERGEEISNSGYALKVRTTNKFIKPFFKDQLLHTIDSNVIHEFAAWRKDYWINQPDDAVIEYERKNGSVLSRPVGDKERNSKPKMLIEKAILNSLFRLAVRKRWLKEWQAPKVDFRNAVIPKGRTKNKRKPYTYFTPTEVNYIREDMLKWALRPVKFQYRRLAAYYYVMLAFSCGVRPGTGIDSLRWKDLKIINVDGDLTDEEKAIRDELTEHVEGSPLSPFIPTDDTVKHELARRKTIPVGKVENYLETWRLDITVPTSKVGHHQSIGLRHAVVALRDYKLAWISMAETFVKKQERRAFNERVPISFEWNEDDPLFLLPNGYHLKGSNASDFFKTYLEETNQTCFEGTEDRRTLYSTRHTFITMLMEKGTPLEMIASFAGTSVEMLKDHYEHASVARVGRKFTDFVVSNL
jgi:hypothetical protein